MVYDANVVIIRDYVTAWELLIGNGMRVFDGVKALRWRDSLVA